VLIRYEQRIRISKASSNQAIKKGKLSLYQSCPQFGAEAPIRQRGADGRRRGNAADPNGEGTAQSLAQAGKGLEGDLPARRKNGESSG